ncbi:OmpA family protein, partial [Bordetella hinzii]|nr:OmpA family protein [Bordetella hinzii]
MRAEQISKRVAVVGVVGALLLAGCATQQQTNTAVGTGAGAALGAGVGALIGHGTGAAIGAGIG